MTWTTAFKAALGLSILLALGCDVTDETRCADIDDSLASKSDQLPRTCEEDIDCLLVNGIHPERPAPTNATPDGDPELDDLRRRRVELCGDFPQPTSVYEALCLDDRCELRATGTIRPDAGGSDVGVDSDSPDVACACAVDADCPSGQTCVDGCVCSGLCQNACGNVDDCEQLVALGLGTSVENCVALCDADVEVNGPELAECLGAAACDNLAACF